MKERPILFSGPMVRAVLSGAKTQTRRVIKPQPPADGSAKEWTWAIDSDAPSPALGWRDDAIGACAAVCPYGQPGDLLWVRETWCPRPEGYGYRADDDPTNQPRKWGPSIFMPRAASRLTLRLTEVRVERVQDISQADAVAEGTQGKASFALLWDALNAKRGYGWASNPFVWVLSFEVVR